MNRPMLKFSPIMIMSIFLLGSHHVALCKEPPEASITITVDKKITEVNPLIYGQFIEHLGKCIKDGLWTPDYKNYELVLGGVRKDVFEAIKKLNMPMLRWPGGCFSDGYHWKDGIGPRESRPTRKNLAWARGDDDETSQGPLENNAFGTDEFLRLCEALETEPLININLGSGTAEEARQWVEYANGDTNTEYGALRATNGHPEPYGVKYWGIGNESWGDYEIGHFSTGKAYAEKYLEFARAMKSADPDIKFLAVGGAPVFSEWNRQVHDEADPEIDFLSVHVYFPGFTLFVKTWEKSKKREYYGIMAAGRTLEGMLDAVDKQVEELVPGDSVRIALDEWNLWWNEQQIIRAEDYDFSSALFTADVLIRLMKRGEKIGFANFAQLVNVLGLVITDPELGMYVTPSYYVFDLFRNEIRGDTVVGSQVESPMFKNHEYGTVMPADDNPLIVAAAVTGQDKSMLDIAVINKHYELPIKTTINIDGDKIYNKCMAREIGAPSPHAMNTFKNPGALEGIVGRECTVTDSEIIYEFPAHSITLIKLSGPDK